MATATKYKVGGSWKDVSDARYKVGGTWKQITQGLIKVGGTWKTFFQLSGAPTVTIDNPTEVSVITVGDVVSIQATATDPDTITEVKFYVKGPGDVGFGYIGNDYTGVSDVFSYSWTASESGEHEIKVEAIDGIGLVGIAEVTYSVIEAGNTDPVVAIDSPSGGATLTVGVQTTIDATATDPDVGDSISEVRFYHDGIYIGKDSTGVGDVFSVNWTPGATGTPDLTAVAYDTRGGSTVSAAVNVTVNAAPVAPTVTITAPADETDYNEGGNVTVVFDYADADGDAVDYRVLIDNAEVVTWTAVGGTGSSGTGESEVLTPSGTGYKRIRVEVRDGGARVGNDVVDVDMNTVVVLPGITWVSPVASSGVEPNVAITLQASVSVGENPISTVEYADVDDLATKYAMTYNGTTGYYEASYTPPNFYDPAITLRIYATDDQGNVSTKSRAFHTDAKPTITSVSSQSVITGTAAVFTVYSYRNEFYQNGDPFADQHTITVQNQPAGTTVNTVNAGDEYVTTITVPNTTPAGTYTMTFEVNDGTWPVVSESVILTVSAVDLAPTATLVVDNATPRQGQTFTLTQTGNDPESKLVRVGLEQWNGAAWTEISANHLPGQGSYLTNDAQFNTGTSKTTPGTYRYRCRATDEGGQYGLSSEVTVTVVSFFTPSFDGNAAPVFTAGVGDTLSFIVRNPNQDDSSNAYTITATADPGNQNQDLKTAAEAMTVTANGFDFDCDIAIGSSINAGSHTITLTMDDGYHAAVIQAIEVKINAAPQIAGGAGTYDLDVTEGQAVTVDVPLSDANGLADIDDASLATSSGTVPDGVTLSIYSPDENEKYIRIAWDGTDAAGSYSFGLTIDDDEGATSDECLVAFEVAAAAASITFAGPTSLNLAGGQSHFIAIRATESNAGNIADMQYAFQGGEVWPQGTDDGEMEVTLQHLVYGDPWDLWTTGNPPSPSADKRRFTFHIHVTGQESAYNPIKIDVTATDAEGNDFVHTLTLTVI